MVDIWLICLDRPRQANGRGGGGGVVEGSGTTRPLRGHDPYSLPTMQQACPLVGGSGVGWWGGGYGNPLAMLLSLFVLLNKEVVIKIHTRPTQTLAPTSSAV